MQLLNQIRQSSNSMKESIFSESHELMPNRSLLDMNVNVDRGNILPAVVLHLIYILLKSFWGTVNDPSFLHQTITISIIMRHLTSVWPVAMEYLRTFFDLDLEVVSELFALLVLTRYWQAQTRWEMQRRKRDTSTSIHQLLLYMRHVEVDQTILLTELSVSVQ